MSGVDAWSPGSLFNFGRGPRLWPVPTNLCVLAGRPRKFSTVQLPEDFDDEGKVTRQQKDLRLALQSYDSTTASTTTVTKASSTFTDDIHEKKVDIASAALQYFSPDPLRENDLYHQTVQQQNDKKFKNSNNGIRNKNNGLESKVRNLQVPQINLPTSLEPLK